MDKVTLYIQYTEPIKFNGFTIETDSIDFAVWIIPLYAKNQKGDVLWDKNDIDTIKKKKM